MLQKASSATVITTNENSLRSDTVSDHVGELCRFVVIFSYYLLIFCATSAGACCAYAMSMTSICLSVCNISELWSRSAMHCRYFDTTRKGSHTPFHLKFVLKVTHQITVCGIRFLVC